MSPVGGRPYLPFSLPPARHLSFHNLWAVRPTVHRSSIALRGRSGRSEARPVDEACVIGVASGSGGVGVSVLTVAIAVRAARAGMRPVCLDGDRLGGGLDVILALD